MMMLLWNGSLANIGKDRLILVKILFEAYQYQPILGSDNTD